MSGWPQLRESRTVRSGRALGTVIRCGLTDLVLADLATSVVFFFERALDDARLAAGLADALDRVPAFAGRLRTCAETLEIVCADAGVQMTTYDIDETLTESMGRATLPGSGLVDHVDAPGARQGGHPLLTVRASRLADGGMALGCSWHHAVGDMQSFMLLMRAWSASVEGTSPPEASFVEDRDAYLDDVLPREDCGRPGFRLPDVGEADRPGRGVEVALRTSRTVQVYFGDAEASRMRQEFSTAIGQRLSASDALCAHVVSTIRRLDEDQEARYLAMPVNIRRYLDLPAAVVGNLISEVYLSCAARIAPARLAAEIRAAIDDFARSHLNLRANRAFLEAIGPSRLRDCVPIGFDPAARTFTFANWSRFGVYDITFEGHHPIFFSPAGSLPVPWVSWLVEGFANTGFLCTICLPARLAGRLRGPEGSAALHSFREPQDVLPALAGAVRKLI